MPRTSKDNQIMVLKAQLGQARKEAETGEPGAHALDTMTGVE